jgi:solute carrier family 66, member 2
MIFVQLVLLQIALTNRPTPGAKEGIEHVPFTTQRQDNTFMGFSRPYNFWRWRNDKPYVTPLPSPRIPRTQERIYVNKCQCRYWTFLGYFTGILFVIHVFLPFISQTETYINILGIAGLTVEAFLPVPQVLANHRSRSCKGFRVSVLGSWLLGDAMKMSYLFYTKDVIPPAFKFCAIFQAMCDGYLGLQYLMYGTSTSKAQYPSEKDIHLG